MTTPYLNSNEHVVWEGSPSQWTNAGIFLFGALFCWALIPILIAIWYWLVVKNTRYILTNERLFSLKGVLNKRVEELELYRVKDYSQVQPLLMRLVGIGTLTVITSDRTDKYIKILGIVDTSKVQGMLREYTERRKISRSVREIDY